MALNADVSFTWVGHGTWKVRSAKGKEILIDPWVMNNPAAPETLKTVDKCDLMLITHGHFDHIHDALEIARRTKPTIVTNLLLVTILNLSEFTLIYAMTQGGPGIETMTLPLYVYQEAFVFHQLGYGTAISLVLVLIGAVFSLLFVRASRSRV